VALAPVAAVAAEAICVFNALVTEALVLGGVLALVAVADAEVIFGACEVVTETVVLGVVIVV
jgi:hypothetical protein